MMRGNDMNHLVVGPGEDPMSSQSFGVEADLYSIGVDGGASKTMAVVLDRQGQERGRGSSGAANPYQVGLEQAKANIMEAMQQAARQAGLGLEQMAAVTWALAGVGRPEEREQVLTLGGDIFPNIPFRVEHDALAALVGGLGRRQGIVLIAGTGMIAYGENEQGVQARAGGWGPLLDQGGGYRLALDALQAVRQNEDHQAFPTTLTRRILETLNLEKVNGLVGWLYQPDRQVADIAGLAPLVLDEAAAGDLAAVEAAVQTAEALAGAVEAVARRLGNGDRPVPVVMAGSLLTQHHFYQDLVAQAIQTRLPLAQPLRPQADAAVGSALLAFEAIGHNPLRDIAQPGLGSSTPPLWSSEQRNLLTHDLDLQPSLTIAWLMHLQDRLAAAAIRATLPVIAQAIDAISERMSRGGRLIYVGAGTSGRLGLLDAAECPPTFNAPPGQVIGLIAGGLQALTGAVEGAEDNTKAGAADIVQLQVGPEDTVVGLAASGRTPYVQGALEEANRRGALTVAVICNLPAPIAEAVRYVIAPLVGPEVITGSTRLKAGTTQKLVLNILSTAVMVRLGKTYGNLMVDVQRTNSKLQGRARRIVAQACGLTETEAARLLAESNGQVKAAIVSALAGCTPPEASRRLAQAGGSVRAALAINDEMEI
jgi:N-acetylmuramic acid 6-phosphate etherase